MAKKSVEQIKHESRFLRATLKETLEGEATHFSDEEYQVLKFHGSYQQDDRDVRKERKRAGLEKAWIYMIRNKLPGGEVSAEQYLAADRIAEELANGSIRLTTRQDFQFHGITKAGLKETIRRIHDSGVTTLGACGDNVRNTLAPASPLATPEHRDAEKLADELTHTFLANSNAYYEIWLDGERVAVDENGDPKESEPIYGRYYLPRKFKIAIGIPPRNDVDIYSNDVGLVPYSENGEVKGYTILVGGGFGMTHGKKETYPRLSRPLFYVAREHVVDACVAIVTTQRDYGNRENRNRARLKYLIDEKGMDWFQQEVESRLNAPTQAPKSFEFNTVGDMLGWHEQGDGNLFCCAYVEEGRIQDTEEVRYRTAFRTIAERFGRPMRVTPNCNLLIYNIAPDQKQEIEQILRENGLPQPDSMTEAKKTAQSCVGLPTCGLALAESERFFPKLMGQIDSVLKELHLESEPILIRMTGCPNGCARPYNADIAFVGRGPGKYAVFIGGSYDGSRLNGLAHKTVDEQDLIPTIRPYLEEFAAHRQNGESFSAYWGRTHPKGPEPHPEQFHEELAQREAQASTVSD